MQISSSYVTTFAPPRPAATLVAVVAADTEGSVTLCQYVDLMDHGSRAFATLDGLIQALQGGVYFDMLLVTLPADVDMTRLLAIRRFSEAPTLFVLPREQLHMLLPVGEALSDLEGIDFVLAPIDPRELKSRLRLLALRGAPFRPQGDLTWGDYRFCVGNRVAFFRDSPVQLKPREFDLALELFRNMGRLMTRERLSSALWGRMPGAHSRTLDVCASHVRRKLGLQAKNNLSLQAVYGRGYQLNAVAPLHPESRHGIDSQPA